MVDYSLPPELATQQLLLLRWLSYTAPTATTFHKCRLAPFAAAINTTAESFPTINFAMSLDAATTFDTATTLSSATALSGRIAHLFSRQRTSARTSRGSRRSTPQCTEPFRESKNCFLCA
jgi:hypothetical protein